MITRRTCLGAGGAMLAGLAFPALLRRARAAEVFEIRMRSDPTGAKVGFDPIGARIEPGQTVRWVLEANVHTATAYHPANDHHALRIPETAEPWDSGYLVDPGAQFEVTLSAEGVYDYFCQPHEVAGMVGRIIVGKPGGPGALPFDYFKAADEHWKPVPPAAQKAFPAIEEILRRKVVPSPLNFSG